MDRNDYAISSFHKWLADLEGHTHGLDLLDLFEWEQAHGNWLAMCQLEFDIAWQDILTPFNCREILKNILCIEPKYRNPPEYELFTRLISHMWPELLNVPINPHVISKKKMINVIKSYVPYRLKKTIKRFLL